MTLQDANNYDKSGPNIRVSVLIVANNRKESIMSVQLANQMFRLHKTSLLETMCVHGRALIPSLDRLIPRPHTHVHFI